MPRCSFCNINIEKGTGVMYVLKTGKIYNFCNRKCEKNMLKLKRKPSKLKWVTRRRKNE